MIFEVSVECIEILKTFQSMVISLIDREWQNLPFKYIIALVNNNSRCVEFTQELFERITPNLEETFLQRMNIDVVAEGFNLVAKSACNALTNRIFNDLESTLNKLFTKDWFESPLIESVVVTIKEYHRDDIADHMLDSYVKKLLSEALDRLVLSYIRAFFTAKYPLAKESIEKMREDDKVIREFFNQMLREKLVEAMMQPIEQIIDLMQAEADMVSVYYDSILALYPDVTIKHLENLLERRQDLSRSQVKSAMEGVKAMMTNRKPVDNIFGDDSKARKLFLK